MAFNANDTIENYKKLIADQEKQDKQQDEDMKRLNPPPAAAPATDGSAAANNEGNQPQTAHELFTVSIGDFIKSAKQLEWLIYGYIQKNALEMCFGPSKSGKSFVILDMALHIAVKKMMEDAAETNDSMIPPELIPPEHMETLKTWHGQVTHGGRVLYVAGEGVTGLKNRALGWFQHYGIGLDKMDNYFRFSPIGTPLDEEDKETQTGGWPHLVGELETLRAQLDFSPDLIIFDTLNRNMLGEENSAKESGVVIQHAQVLMKEYGCTVIFIHHTGLSAVAKDRARGSSAWRGAMDIEFSVKHGQITTPISEVEKICGIAPAHPPKTHYAVIDVTKCKDAEEQPRRELERVPFDLEKADGSGPMYNEDGSRATTLILKTPAKYPSGIEVDAEDPEITKSTPSAFKDDDNASGAGKDADDSEDIPTV